MALTPAARRGLRAFDEDGVARRSNITDAKRNLVYWQTIASLLRTGLCRPHRGDLYVLTDVGLRLREQLP